MGCKVPNGNTITGFKTFDYIGSFDAGYKFRRYSGDTVGVFFPAAGHRSMSTGNIGDTGSSGNIWTSASSDQNTASQFRFANGDIIQYTTLQRAYGASIRPVQDDLTDVDPIIISFTINGTTYASESGMTWLQWTQSSYNTGGYVTTGGGFVCHGGRIDRALKYNGNNVMKTDVVIGGAAYTHST